MRDPEPGRYRPADRANCAFLRSGRAEKDRKKPAGRRGAKKGATGAKREGANPAGRATGLNPGAAGGGRRRPTGGGGDRRAGDGQDQAPWSARIAYLVEQGVSGLPHYRRHLYQQGGGGNAPAAGGRISGTSARSRTMTIGTFHCRLPAAFKEMGGSSADSGSAARRCPWRRRPVAAANYTGSPLRLLEGVSRIKNGAAAPDTPEGVPAAAYDAYCRLQRRFGARDYDDLLLDVLHRMEEGREEPRRLLPSPVWMNSRISTTCSTG